jgi:hypothetical protein
MKSRSVLYILSWITCVHRHGLCYTYSPGSHVFIITVCVIHTLLYHMCSSSRAVLCIFSWITCVRHHVCITQTVKMNTCDTGEYVYHRPWRWTNVIQESMYNTDRDDEHMWSRRICITQPVTMNTVHHHCLCYTYSPVSHVFIITVCVIHTLLDHMCSSSRSVLRRVCITQTVMMNTCDPGEYV